MHKGLLLTYTLLLSVLGYGQTISGLITDEANCDFKQSYDIIS